MSQLKTPTLDEKPVPYSHIFYLLNKIKSKQRFLGYDHGQNGGQLRQVLYLFNKNHPFCDFWKQYIFQHWNSYWGQVGKQIVVGLGICPGPVKNMADHSKENFSQMNMRNGSYEEYDERQVSRRSAREMNFRDQNLQKTMNARIDDLMNKMKREIKTDIEENRHQLQISLDDIPSRKQINEMILQGIRRALPKPEEPLSMGRNLG